MDLEKSPELRVTAWRFHAAESSAGLSLLGETSSMHRVYSRLFENFDSDVLGSEVTEPHTAQSAT